MILTKAFVSAEASGLLKPMRARYPNSILVNFLLYCWSMKRNDLSFAGGTHPGCRPTGISPCGPVGLFIFLAPLYHQEADEWSDCCSRVWQKQKMCFKGAKCIGNGTVTQARELPVLKAF